MNTLTHPTLPALLLGTLMIAALHALATTGHVPRETVAKAIKDMDVDPEKACPICV